MSFLSPKETVEAIQEKGNGKAHLTVDQDFVLAFMSGMYIGLGGLLAIMVGGNIPDIQQKNPGLQKLIFGTTFSVSLMFVVHTGADLWTGSIQLLNISLLSPKTRLVDIIHTFKILVVSFIGNFCGATFVAFFFCYLINMHSTEPWVAFLKAYGEKKTSKEPWFLFISAIGCNILVNTAYFMSIVAGDVSGKLLSVLAGIGTFVTIGFEHVVANMFFLPAAAFFGANFPVWKLFFWNIAVVAFGNYIGGVFLFGLTLWYGHVYRPAHKSCFYNLYSTSARRFAKARGNGAENTTNTFHIATSHDQDISARELEEHPLQPTATTTAVPTQFQV